MNDFARSIKSIVVFLSICLISFQAHANREYLNSKIEQAGMWYTRVAVTGDGTSFAAPYIAGIFAIACQAAGTLYNTAPTAASLYTALRNTGTIGTVTNTNGTPLTGATSRFIRQQW